jgi:hypothetical protein
VSKCLGDRVNGIALGKSWPRHERGDILEGASMKIGQH